jgi:hypothetical protein
VYACRVGVHIYLCISTCDTCTHTHTHTHVLNTLVALVTTALIARVKADSSFSGQNPRGFGGAAAGAVMWLGESLEDLVSLATPRGSTPSFIPRGQPPGGGEAPPPTYTGLFQRANG